MTVHNENDVVEAIRGAAGPLRIIGGGTRPIARAAGEVLSMARLSGITLYEPGALTLVAQVGTSVAEIEAALAAENQRLAFEPMDHRALLGTAGEPTIGGVVAANVSGSRRISVGACRDFMLGVRFVDGAGHLIKNGGRVMKNVTGYDLVKLMTGSYGTLGALTQVSMKVLPKPETQATLVIDGLDVNAAVAAMSAGLASAYEVTGAAYVSGQAMLRIEGFRGSVAYRLGKLQSALAAFGNVTDVTDPDESQSLWRTVRDVMPLAAHPGDIWRISARPSAAPAIVVALPEGTATMLDWGGGLIWAAVPAGRDIRPMLPDAGHATLIRGVADVPVFHPEPAPLAAISKGLRAKFDPRGILNAGAMG